MTTVIAKYQCNSAKFFDPWCPKDEYNPFAKEAQCRGIIKNLCHDKYSTKHTYRSSGSKATRKRSFIHNCCRKGKNMNHAGTGKFACTGRIGYKVPHTRFGPSFWCVDRKSGDEKFAIVPNVIAKPVDDALKWASDTFFNW